MSVQRRNKSDEKCNDVIELLNQSDFIELNSFKMDRLKLFFPVRQSGDECGEKGKMEAQQLQ